MKKLLIALIFGGYFSLRVVAQAPHESYLMNFEIEQAIIKLRTTESNAELLQRLSALQGQKGQAAQVLLASTSLLDLEERNDIVAMIFRLPIDEDGINLTHIPLLVDLYVKSAQSPLPSKPRPRSFLNDFVLQSRLLDIFAALLEIESVRPTLQAGGPLPRLLRLLEAVRGSRSLPASAQKMIEDSIIKVERAANAALNKPDAQQPAWQQKQAPNVPSMPKVSETKPVLPSSTGKPSSLTALSIIGVLIVATTGLLWLLLKRRS